MDMSNHFLVCQCGMIAVRYLANTAQHRGRYLWRCPQDRGKQCTVFVWESTLRDWITRYPQALIPRVGTDPEQFDMTAEDQAEDQAEGENYFPDADPNFDEEMWEEDIETDVHFPEGTTNLMEPDF